MDIENIQDLITHINLGNRVKYCYFWEYEEKGSSVSKSCFSQWYDAPFEDGGQSYNDASKTSRTLLM